MNEVFIELWSNQLLFDIKWEKFEFVLYMWMNLSMPLRLIKYPRAAEPLYISS